MIREALFYLGFCGGKRLEKYPYGLRLCQASIYSLLRLGQKYFSQSKSRTFKEHFIIVS